MKVRKATSSKVMETQVHGNKSKPKPQICHACHGSGLVNNNRTFIVCDICGGSGEKL